MTSDPEGREGACQDTVRGGSLSQLETSQNHNLPVRAELPVAPDSHSVPVTSPKQDVKDESDVC